MIQTVNMPAAAALFGVGVLFYFVIYPIFEYFRDPKGRHNLMTHRSGYANGAKVCESSQI